MLLQYRLNRHIPAKMNVRLSSMKRENLKLSSLCAEFWCNSTAHLFHFDLFQLDLLLKWDEMCNEEEKREDEAK